MTRRHPHVVNVDEVEPQVRETGTRFGAVMRSLGPAAGSKQLGCIAYEVKPGRAAFPKHFHASTEEAIYILEGEGVLRIGDTDEVPVRAGDYLAFPVGPDAAHQVVNRGTQTLRYLCFSTTPLVDVVVYPDSKKIAAMATDDPGAWRNGKFWVRQIHKQGESLGYWEGEDVG